MPVCLQKLQKFLDLQREGRRKYKENTSYKEFDGGWYLVNIEDNELKVIINRNETKASRSFTVCVEAGNAFDEFKFVQDAAKQ